MLAKLLMSHPVVTVRPLLPARDAAALLAGHGFTALSVVDGDGDLVGIVTEADLMRGRIPPDPRAGSAPGPPPPRTVGEVMTTPVVTVRPGTDLADVVRLMVDHGHRALPVLDPGPDGHLVGIVTRRDLMRCVGRGDAAVAADVRRRLDLLDGPGRWTVRADAGLVTIAGEPDGRTAGPVAAAVPGVAAVLVLPPEPTGDTGDRPRR